VKRAAIRGPPATAIAPADATSPYALGRFGRAKFDATRSTIAGMISAAPIPSRTDHPTEQLRDSARRGREEPQP